MREITTDADQVRQLLAEQFPHWAARPVTALPPAGTDHLLYRIGDDLVARMPRIEWALGQVETDRRWLPVLAPHLPVAVPVPVAIGEPGAGYPWRWSIVPWLPGENPTIGDVDRGAAGGGPTVASAGHAPAGRAGAGGDPTAAGVGRTTAGGAPSAAGVGRAAAGGAPTVAGTGRAADPTAAGAGHAAAGGAPTVAGTGRAADPTVAGVGRAAAGGDPTVAGVGRGGADGEPTTADAGHATAGGDPTTGNIDPEVLAADLAGFVAAMGRIDTAGGPPKTGTERGVPLAARDDITRAAIAELGDRVDGRAMTKAWDAALAADPADRPVWIHGDLSTGNVLVRDGRLSAVIDFVALGVGDPAIELLPAWDIGATRFRRAYREALGCDDATWERGKGWVLSIALVAMPYYWDRDPAGVADDRDWIAEVLAHS